MENNRIKSIDIKPTAGGAFVRRICNTVIIGSLVLLMAGCTTVRFNERERLSQPDMTFDRDPLESKIRSHVLTPRQGAAGDFATGGGGGCGCN